MKLLILVIALFSVSCKKDKEDCYICKHKDGNTLVKVETLCSPQPGSSSYHDTNGDYIVVTCTLKD